MLRLLGVEGWIGAAVWVLGLTLSLETHWWLVGGLSETLLDRFWGTVNVGGPINVGRRIILPRGCCFDSGIFWKFANLDQPIHCEESPNLWTKELTGEGTLLLVQSLKKRGEVWRITSCCGRNIGTVVGILKTEKGYRHCLDKILDRLYPGKQVTAFKTAKSIYKDRAPYWFAKSETFIAAQCLEIRNLCPCESCAFWGGRRVIFFSSTRIVFGCVVAVWTRGWSSRSCLIFLGFGSSCARDLSTRRRWTEHCQLMGEKGLPL